MQIVFQDPYASLDPAHRVEKALMEPFAIHGIGTRHEQRAHVTSLLERVGLDPDMRRRFPREFSGGQRQRIAIARAIALEPSLIVCDEPVSALDVSIQAQVLNLLRRLQIDLGLTYLFISHDLGVVHHVSDRVVIMYLGRVVEEASTEEIFGHANHPYTRALLAETPRIELARRDFNPISGEMPSPSNPPPGCHFHPRCPHAMAVCRVEVPPLEEVAPGHRSACHLNRTSPISIAPGEPTHA